MVNSIGWGQGADNNSIGWGQGAINNIAWGKECYNSDSQQTDLTGDYAFLDTFITSFSDVVTTDLGVFEGTSCLYYTIKSYISNGGILFAPFNERTIADGGIIESNVCLINFVNSLT